MGHQIIQQPDGLLCVFSTVTDSIIIRDATAAELIADYAEMAAVEARERIRRIIDLVEAGDARKAYYQFTMTYDEAVEMDLAR